MIQVHVVQAFRVQVPGSALAKKNKEETSNTDTKEKSL
jgi:hypothetical protein